jgi:imidazolonepropionase-like amidohydrolase
MATGGFMTARTAPWNAQFTTDELRALVEDAHRLGKHTAAHAHGTEGIARRHHLGRARHDDGRRGARPLL